MSFFECNGCGAIPGVTYSCVCKNSDDSNVYNSLPKTSKTISTDNLIYKSKRREKFLENLNKYVHINLREKVLEVFDSNPSQHLPYHNNHHMMAVTNRAIDLFLTDCKLNGVRPNDSTLQRLFIACAFHDFNHSGGKLKDNLNISRALEGVKKLGIADIDFKHVSQIIKCTEFPFLPWFKPFTLSEKCIRDADLMMILEDDFNDFMVGLSLETGKLINRESTLEFLKKQEFYTETAKNIMKCALS